MPVWILNISSCHDSPDLSRVCRELCCWRLWWPSSMCSEHLCCWTCNVKCREGWREDIYHGTSNSLWSSATVSNRDLRRVVPRTGGGDSPVNKNGYRYDTRMQFKLNLRHLSWTSREGHSMSGKISCLYKVKTISTTHSNQREGSGSCVNLTCSANDLHPMSKVRSHSYVSPSIGLKGFEHLRAVDE